MDFMLALFLFIIIYLMMNTASNVKTAFRCIAYDANLQPQFLYTILGIRIARNLFAIAAVSVASNGIEAGADRGHELIITLGFVITLAVLDVALTRLKHRQLLRWADDQHLND